MSTLTIVLLVILVVLIIACIVLYFLGKKAEKKQAEQQEQLDAVKQTISILVIDKGRVRLRDAGFPPIVLEVLSRFRRRKRDFLQNSETNKCERDRQYPPVPFIVFRSP